MNQELLRQQQFKWTRTGYHPEYNSQLSKYKVFSCLEQISLHCSDKNSQERSLLDIACGDGFITEQLSSHFGKVVGVDANSDVIEQAKTRVPSAEFHNALAEEFYSDELFSVVTLLDLLEHVQSPVNLLSHLKSFLKPEGVLIIHVPNALAINRQLNVLMGSLTHCEELSPFDIEIAGHRRSYCTQTLLEDIRSAGLVPVDQGGIFLKLLSTPQMDYLLSASQWGNAEHGWGRSGDKSVNWKDRFCEASYKLGNEHPEMCNVIHVTCKLA
jgi:SAM-dependent methyltransferase